MSLLFAHCGILAWEDNAFRYIPDGYLGVRDGVIDFVGPRKPDAVYDEVRDFSGKLLMPGLVNCHCHAAMTLLRGIGSDLPLDRWLFEEMFPVEDRMTTEDIAAGNELAMMEMIASGTTSFSDMYADPRALVRSNETIGMKVNLARVVQSFDPAEDPKDNFRLWESLAFFEEMNGVQSGRVKADFSIHAEYTCTDAVARAYCDHIRPLREKGARMHIHLAETEKEQRECVERHGCTPARWFEQMGAFDVPAAAAHCVCVTKEDIGILKRHNVSVIHNPTSNMKLGSGFAPIPELLDEGVNVALGTDGAASNNNLNLFEEMHLAAVMHNGYHRDAVMMKPEQVLRMATVNGARLQGRDDTGALAVGKRADVIAIDFRNRAHLYPAFDPMVMLVYAVQASDVCMTMVDGRILYEDGRFYTLDPERVLKNAAAAVQRLYGEAR